MKNRRLKAKSSNQKCDEEDQRASALAERRAFLADIEEDLALMHARCSLFTDKELIANIKEDIAWLEKRRSETMAKLQRLDPDAAHPLAPRPSRLLLP